MTICTMKKLFAAIAVSLLLPCVSSADIATFDAAQGWVDGNVLPTTQTTQTSGLNWVSNQNGAYTVDSTAGTLSVASASFLRQTFDLGGGGLDIPTGGSITYDAVVDPSGLAAFAANRILLEIALAAPTDPGNATTGNASNGVQLRSNGTNWFVDEPAFGSDSNVDTGIALASGPLTISMVYEETSATNVDFELFLNGASVYTDSLTGDITGAGLYGWTNSSQGTGTGGTLAFNSIGLTVVPAAVPEPSTLGILGLGLAGLFGRRRRR